MKILENLITDAENDPTIFDNTLLIENIVGGNRTLDIENATTIIVAQNGTVTTFPNYTAQNFGASFIICNQEINVFDFSARNIVAMNIPDTNAYTEIQAGVWHDLPGGEVSSTGKRTTAQSERTASGVVFEDVAGYEFEEYNVQIPYITIEQYDNIKNINLSVPYFIKFEGEFKRTDTVFCTISELTVQTIGLQAGYTLQLGLREAK